MSSGIAIDGFGDFTDSIIINDGSIEDCKINPENLYKRDFQKNIIGFMLNKSSS
jgi:hypothetical protein